MSMGILGMYYPWLMKSEVLHYGFALVMLIGLWVLRKGFTGDAYKWWMVSFWIQFWHHIEHFILFYQAQTQRFWFGGTVPTSIGQIWIPRIELHLITICSCSFQWSSRYRNTGKPGRRPRRAPTEPRP
jgi:hypothetical protein